MPRLTFQSVASPNFSGTAQSLRVFNELFQDALGNARGVVQGIENQNEDRANAAYQAAISRFTDAEQLRTALAQDPTLGIRNGNRLSAEAIADARNRAPQLLREQAQQFGFNDEVRRAEQLRAADADRVAVQRLVAAGRIDEALALARSSESIGALDADQNQSFLENIFSNRTNSTSATRGEFELGEDISDARSSRLANEATASLRGDPSVVTTADARARIQELGLPASVADKVRANLGLNRDLLEASAGTPGIAGGVTGAAPTAQPTGSGGATFGDNIGRLIQREGGYVNDPRDSGGATRYGITEAVARENGYTGDMKDLPLSFAESVYEEKYWKPIEAAGVPENAREAVFDFGVNAGVNRSLDFWKKSGGDINKFNELREAHYRSLSNFDRFGNGWLKRIAETTPAAAGSTPASAGAPPAGAQAAPQGGNRAQQVSQAINGIISPFDIAQIEADLEAGRLGRETNLTSDPTLNSYFSFAGWKGNPADAENELREQYPTQMENIDSVQFGEMMGTIRSIAQENGLKINDRQAAELLISNREEAGFFSYDYAVKNRPWTLNEKAIEDGVKAIKAGEAEGAASALAGVEISRAEGQAALDKFQSAQAAFQRAVEGGDPATIQRYQQAYLIAAQQLRGIQDQTVRSGNATFQGNGLQGPQGRVALPAYQEAKRRKLKGDLPDFAGSFLQRAQLIDGLSRNDPTVSGLAARAIANAAAQNAKADAAAADLDLHLTNARRRQIR